MTAYANALAVLWTAAGMVLLAVCLWIAVVVVHELGHFLMGVAAGFEFVQAVLFNVQITFSHGLKISRGHGYLIRGMVQMRARRSGLLSLSLRYILFIAAGPVVNVATGLAARGLAANAHGFWAVLGGAYMVFSFGLAAMCLVPARAGLNTSDGFKLKTMIFSERGRELTLARLTFYQNLAAFRRSFDAGSLELADLELTWMEKAFTEGGSKQMHDWLSHLREHLTTREPLATCQWIPKVQTSLQYESK